MPEISLVIVAHKFTWNIDDISDGLTHRYYGLYANLCKLLLKGGNKKVYWYDAADRRLLTVSQARVDKFGISMSLGLLKTMKESLSNDMFPLIVMDYPHSFTGVKHLLDYVISLLILHTLRLTKHTFVVVDNVDPPIEHLLELRGRARLSELMLWRVLNRLVFHFDLIVFHTNSYRNYHIRKYGVKRDKTLVIRPGSFPQQIPYKKPPHGCPLRILYAGRITKWNNAGNLINVVNELLDEGFSLELLTTRKKYSFTEYAELLSKAHILVIPYPKTLHHLLTMRAKLADYMMAGRPILFTESPGMAEVIVPANCGFAFDDIYELKRLVIRLCQDRDLTELTGYRARNFAKNHMVYSKHTKHLLNEILSRVKNREILKSV